MDIQVIHRVMKVNDEIAAEVRQRLEALGLRALNLISGPGSGKTSLIEVTIEKLRDELRIGVIEGDPDTSLDAERLAKHNVPVTQINTEGGCHLEANLVNRALESFDLKALDLLFIENVGNLVCPVSFDLGESGRIAVVSVTEGADKPAKYPMLFRSADVVVLNKVDLLPYVDFDVEVFASYVRRLKPEMPILHVSCKSGEGIEEWCAWLRNQAAKPAPA